jgi:hypothetical protein
MSREWRVWGEGRPPSPRMIQYPTAALMRGATWLRTARVAKQKGILRVVSISFRGLDSVLVGQGGSDQW